VCPILASKMYKLKDFMLINVKLIVKYILKGQYVSFI